ncbi:MAG: hypothetical protein ACI835_005991 [Planctomycetota bacterium]|jgi:hypothetical protein
MRYLIAPCWTQPNASSTHNLCQRLARTNSACGIDDSMHTPLLLD